MYLESMDLSVALIFSLIYTPIINNQNLNLMASKVFLLIDDDIDDHNFFVEAVSAVDSTAQCLGAMDGEDGLSKLRADPQQLPDYIFLDLNMPRMDGKSCLSEISKDGNLKNIPVIIFSTSSNPVDVMETRELGASYYLVKPYDFNTLCKEINFVINKF